MSTGPEMPLTVMVPSVCGSDRRRNTYTPTTASATRIASAIDALSSHRCMRKSYTVIHESSLKPVLDRLYSDFNYPDSAADPIQIVRRYERGDDREVVAFCAASLAFGRVASVLQSIERLMAILGPRPAEYVRGFDPARDGAAFRGFVHRWTRDRDLVALIWILRQMLDGSGSVEAFFLGGYDPDAPDLASALDSFSARAMALDLKAAYGRVPKRPGVG